MNAINGPVELYPFVDSVECNGTALIRTTFGCVTNFNGGIPEHVEFSSELIPDVGGVEYPEIFYFGTNYGCFEAEICPRMSPISSLIWEVILNGTHRCSIARCPTIPLQGRRGFPPYFWLAPVGLGSLVVICVIVTVCILARSSKKEKWVEERPKTY